MPEHMTHEEYVATIKKRVVETAQSMIDGSLSFLEGARALVALRNDAEVNYNDSDFMAFVVIDSDCDHLPIGAVRQYWSKDALSKLDPDIAQSEAWAKEIGFESCESLIRRFHV